MPKKPKVAPEVVVNTRHGIVEPELESPAHDIGIAKNRKCRDVPCLILFFVFWVGMAIVAYSAHANGDPRKIIMATDYLGNFCGSENLGNTNAHRNQSSRPYLYYFNLFALSAEAYVCVEQCPTVTQATLLPSNVICQYDVIATNLNVASLISGGNCTSYTYASSPVLSRCVPIDTNANITAVANNTASDFSKMSTADIINAGKSAVVSSVSDIYNGWPVLAAGLGLCVILCFIWLVLLQVLAAIIAWITIILINLILCGASTWLYFYWQAQLALYNSSTLAKDSTINAINQIAGINQAVSRTTLTLGEIQYVGYGFYTLAAVSGIVLLITIAMIKRIRIAVQVIKLASKAVMKMPLIVFFPVFAWAAICGTIAYFIYFGLCILTPVSTPYLSIFSFFKIPVTTDVATYLLPYYHLFGTLWGIWFFSGFNQVALAGAIGTWYWTLDKTQKLRSPVLRSVSRTCRYHLGSIALGSLLIAVVELIRIIFYQVTKQVNSLKSDWLKFAVACAQCFLKCVSMIIKFINKNAYIYIAITGKPFFSSAGRAASLLLRNAAKTVAINFVADFILLISKLIVSVGTGFGIYVYLAYAGQTNWTIRNPYVIACVGGVSAFVVAIAFFSVYHMAIDTIFLSALEDIEINDGSKSRPYYMPDSLAKILGVSNDNVKSPKENGKSPKQPSPKKTQRVDEF